MHLKFSSSQSNRIWHYVCSVSYGVVSLMKIYRKHFHQPYEDNRNFNTFKILNIQWRYEVNWCLWSMVLSHMARKNLPMTKRRLSLMQTNQNFCVRPLLYSPSLAEKRLYTYTKTCKRDLTHRWVSSILKVYCNNLFSSTRSLTTDIVQVHSRL